MGVGRGPVPCASFMRTAHPRSGSWHPGHPIAHNPQRRGTRSRSPPLVRCASNGRNSWRRRAYNACWPPPQQRGERPAHHQRKGERRQNHCEQRAAQSGAEATGRRAAAAIDLLEVLRRCGRVADCVCERAQPLCGERHLVAGLQPPTERFREGSGKARRLLLHLVGCGPPADLEAAAVRDGAHPDELT